MSISAALERLRANIKEKVNSIDRYQNPCEHLEKGTYTDVFGEFTVGTSQNGETTFLQGNTIVPVQNLECDVHKLRAVPVMNSSYVDLTRGGIVDALDLEGGTLALNPCCLILPRINYSAYTICFGKVNRENTQYLYRGLYLHEYNYYAKSNWIPEGYVNARNTNIARGTGYRVKAPPGITYSLYLQNIAVDTQDLVDLINSLGTVKGKALMLGTDNRYRLTSEQIAVAEEKGWIVS